MMERLRERIEAHEVGFSPINDIADVFANPQFVAREALVTVTDSELGAVRMQDVVPRFSPTPGRLRSSGPALGQHNDETWAALCYDRGQIDELRAAGVI